MKNLIKTIAMHLLPCALLTLGASSCSSDSDDPDPAPKGDGKSRSIEITAAEEDASRQSNLFAWDLLEKCMGQSTGNVVLSPISANICLSMVANATAGNSRAQILNALGFGEEEMTDVNSLNSKLAKQICSIDHNVQLALANSFWYDPDIYVKKDFIKNLEDNYDIGSYTINPATFSKDVNKWCADKTYGLIPRILDDDDLYAFAFLNAIYFKGYWNGDFKFNKKDTKKDVFNNADGTKSKVNYMHKKREYNCLTAPKWKAMLIPFGGGGFQFTVILPNEGCSIDECLESIKETEPATCKFTGCGSLDVKLPKFKMDQELNLSDVLMQMGIVDIFQELQADFSNMTDNDMYVDMAKQKVSFEVTEEGAEAAAVTVIGGFVATGMPTEVSYSPFHVDRPFIFMISEQSTGAILFLGNINKF